MPSKQKHIKQAEKNERFFISFPLASTPYLDWVVTGMFYTALHYVDAYLAAKSIHPSDHYERNQLVAREKELRLIEQEYLSLYNSSRLARYECKEFKPSEVRTILDTDLTKVCNHVKPLL